MRNGARVKDKISVRVTEKVFKRMALTCERRSEEQPIESVYNSVVDFSTGLL